MASRGGQWPHVSINLNDHNSGLNKPCVHLGTITHLTPTAKTEALGGVLFAELGQDMVAW